MDYSITELRSAFNVALVTNVSCNFRMICIDWYEQEWIKVKVYTENKISENDKELLRCILTDLPQDIIFDKYIKEIEQNVIPIPDLDCYRLVIYARNEEEQMMFL